MKKIGIITITDYLNYGNRLQNFATQEVLKSKGFEVESILNEFPTQEVDKSSSSYLYRLKNALKLSPVTLINKITEKIDQKVNRNKYLLAKKSKEKSFRAFSKKHLIETDFTISDKNIPSNLGELYDYFVVGSDQIWNPKIRFGSPIDFLTFAPKNKRIAFAPSFGVSSIPEVYESKYAKWLSEMAYLSVREQAGADIIKKLTGLNCPVHIDPTLMLTKENWLSISECGRQKPVSKYLLTYFIGAVSKKRKKNIQEIAEKHNLEIVQLASLKDIERYDASPGEFIDYINSSTLVCTDSFHAIIFSMQMEKPFVVFDREGKSAPMSSRIDTLLGKFQFENRKYTEIVKTNKWIEISYSHFSKILEKERKNVIDYLTKSLV